MDPCLFVVQGPCCFDESQVPDVYLKTHGLFFGIGSGLSKLVLGGLILAA